MGGWRFLVHEKRPRLAASDGAKTESEEYTPIAAATAVLTAGSTYELGELNEGPFVTGTEEAVRRAEKSEEVRKRRFDALMLIVPAIYVAALWLWDRDGEADTVLTIPPSNPALVPYQPMTTAAFLDVVHRLAQKVPPDAATAG